MERINIVYKNINDLKMYKNNPRKNKDAIPYVKESIKQFGFKVPVIIDKNNEIVCGHTRVLASKELNIQEIPCIIADDLTDEQIKAFRLADNKTGEKAEWDYDLLEYELENLVNFDMDSLGFDLGEDFDISDDEDVEDDKYTKKVDIPQYQITGEEPLLRDLINTKKRDELIEKIKSSNITNEQKQFLIDSAQRHSVFNYSKIAEYYAHQSKEMQELMEESALVIIDFNNAIRDGFVELQAEIDEMEKEDSEDEE